MILEFILELCEKSGVEFLSLEVRKSNERAQNLYQSFGFQKHLLVRIIIQMVKMHMLWLNILR